MGAASGTPGSTDRGTDRGTDGGTDGATTEPRQVLVVHDDSLTRDVLATVLDLREYELVEATDGKEALVQADAHDVELAVLDAVTPGIDGYEICNRLKAEHTDIRVVLLTGDDSPAVHERGRAAGADASLTTPFSPLELIDTMRQLLEAS